jgi:hypothetical protein
LFSRRGFVPLDREQKLEAFGQTPQYQAWLEQMAILKVRFERSASETGLIEALDERLKGPVK